MIRAYNLLCAVAMCDCESVSPSLLQSERARGRRSRRGRSVGQSLDDVASIALGRYTSLPPSPVVPSQMHLTRLSPSLVQCGWTLIRHLKLATRFGEEAENGAKSTIVCETHLNLTHMPRR